MDDGPIDDDVAGQLARADAAYEPILPFAGWATDRVATGSWESAAVRLADIRVSTPVDVVRGALDETLRAAAVDTGAIEGLYDTDRGFTLSVARNLISMDQAEVERGPVFRRSFEAQYAGFEMALLLATSDEVLTEAAVRELHRVTCAGQATYRVLRPLGVQERDLALGAYKSEANHVQLGDGTFHAYAPVRQVGDEMHAVRTAEVISEQLSAAVADDRGAQVLVTDEATPSVPPGVRIPVGASVVVHAEGTSMSTWILSVGIDRAADDLSRFCVVASDPTSSEVTARREGFTLEELAPDPSPAARRRLDRLVRLLVADARTAPG